MPPNTACTPPSAGSGRAGGSLRGSRQFAWLEAGSGKMALSRPTHQWVTQAVGQRGVTISDANFILK